MTLRTTIAAALAALLLGGCSPATPDPVSTPAPSDPVSTPAPSDPLGAPSASEDVSAPSPAATTPAPGESPSAPPNLVGDEAERNAAVVPSFLAYWDVVNQTYAAGGAAEATDDMLRTMTGQQLQTWVNIFSAWREAGNRYEGVNRVLYANPTMVTLEPDGGIADVEFCVDMTGTRAFDADGNPLEKDGRYQSGVAVLQWIDGEWKVAGHREGTANSDAC